VVKEEKRGGRMDVKAIVGITLTNKQTHHISYGGV